jgi:hypothetical protein
MENKILWEKWRDPFVPKDNEDSTSEDDDDDDDTYKDSYQIAESNAKKSQSKPASTGPVLVGPMGVVPLNESSVPSKIYNFWMGHCNFDITPQVLSKINTTAGVEALDVFTRYRFRIAVGKAFKEKEVFKAIESNLFPKLVKAKEPQPIKQANMLQLVKYMKGKYKHWAIFALPDGTLYTRGAETLDEIHAEVNNRKEPTVATSWE